MTEPTHPEQAPSEKKTWQGWMREGIYKTMVNFTWFITVTAEIIRE